MVSPGRRARRAGKRNTSLPLFCPSIRSRPDQRRTAPSLQYIIQQASRHSATKSPPCARSQGRKSEEPTQARSSQPKIPRRLQFCYRSEIRSEEPEGGSPGDARHDGQDTAPRRPRPGRPAGLLDRHAVVHGRGGHGVLGRGRRGRGLG